MNIDSLRHYVCTVAYLKPRQIAFQLGRRLGRTKKILPVTGSISLRQGMALTPPLCRRLQGEECTLTFLNITRRFDPAQFDWASPEADKLWCYNLHYFDYLNEEERSFENKALLVNSWIEKNPQGTPDAWEPFPVSLRMVNWIKFFSSREVNKKLEEHWLKSLYEQALWLERNIEYHLLANHYFKNGKALIFAGLFFAGDDAERWLKKGSSIIGEELDEQILADGGHFERSPMYHSMIFEDCLDLLNIMKGCEEVKQDGLREKLAASTGQMSRFLALMCHPDGKIALFNDSAFGIEAAPSDLLAYHERLTRDTLQLTDDRCLSLPATGYFIMSPASDDRLFIDCGPIGPDYQPGHSHCDALSIELSLRGKRVIVDSGCYGYEEGPIRAYNRGNAGHNSVTIDGENQSEVWASHRCARRARPLYARLNEADNALVFEGAHDGYKRLYGKPVHHRKIVWQSGRIDIEDTIDGEEKHDIELRLHIHPDLKVSTVGGEAAIRDDDAIIARIQAMPKGNIAIQKGWYCPEFGKKVSCIVLVNERRGVQLPFKTGWTIHIP